MEDYKYLLAHRYVFACFNDLDERDRVRHKCHNKKCCNPEHLELGTHKDNWHDSKEIHLIASSKTRKKWFVDGVKYNTVRDASKQTGIHQGTLIKYTVEGVFNISAYRDGCKKSNKIPMV